MSPFSSYPAIVAYAAQSAIGLMVLVQLLFLMCFSFKAFVIAVLLLKGRY